jgi:hypothetical protein
MRKTFARTVLAAALGAAFAGAASAAHLLPAGPDDLVGLRTVALPAPTGAIERKPVAFGWALDPAADVRAAAPFVAESREFWTEVDAAKLQRGLPIDTTAPGAVVRLSPIGKAAALTPSALQLGRNGKALAAGVAFAHRADAEQLRAAGFDAGAGAAVVQVSPSLGAGRFELRMASAEGRYLLHVYEPASTTVLHARTSRPAVLAGQRLDVAARLDAGAKAAPDTQFGGLLVSPSGRTLPIDFVAARDGSVRATVALPANAAVEPGLWEAQVFAEGGDATQRVQRDGRAAFAVAQPLAKLAGDYRFDRAALAFALPLEVGAPGRYEVAGTLFATGADGVTRPVAQAASAAWFEPGQRALTLAFDRTHVPAGYGAPYELRQLQLKDQARMGLLESRERAARVTLVAMRD